MLKITNNKATSGILNLFTEVEEDKLSVIFTDFILNLQGCKHDNVR